jgi:hypothetical protein
MSGIAIGLYGQPRFYRVGYTEIKKNIIDPLINIGYKVDVYFHTWWHEGDIGMRFPRAPWAQLTENDLTIKPGVLDWLVENYKPVAYKNESVEVAKSLKLPEDVNGYDNGYSIPQTLPIFYTVKQMADLVKNGVEKDSLPKYHRVIKLRFDMCFDGIDIIELVKRDKFLVGGSTQPNAVSDMMSVSNYDDFIHSCEVYDNLSTLAKNTLFNMEQLFLANLLLHNIDYEETNFGQGLLRSEGVRFFPSGDVPSPDPLSK